MITSNMNFSICVHLCSSVANSVFPWLIPRRSAVRSRLGQPVGLAGDGQRIAAVLLADLPRVGMVADPGELVGHHRAEQLAVTVRFLDPLAPGELDHLVDVERLVARLADAILGPIGHRDVEPGAGEEVAKGAGLRLVDDGVDP